MARVAPKQKGPLSRSVAGSDKSSHDLTGGVEWISTAAHSQYMEKCHVPNHQPDMISGQLTNHSIINQCFFYHYHVYHGYIPNISKPPARIWDSIIFPNMESRHSTEKKDPCWSTGKFGDKERGIPSQTTCLCACVIVSKFHYIFVPWYSMNIPLMIS